MRGTALMRGTLMRGTSVLHFIRIGTQGKTETEAIAARAFSKPSEFKESTANQSANSPQPSMITI